MTRHRLSPHFTVEEFDCRDGSKVPSAAVAAAERWARMWGEPLRTAFGPVRVTSGYRTERYNRSVGGAPRSYHRYDLHHPSVRVSRSTWDLAADVVPARGTPAEWMRWARARLSAGTGGWGPSNGAAVAYPREGFIHLDTGPRRTWVG